MKLAVVCAAGIGDALILKIVSTQLERNGFAVTTFSNHLSNFGDWFKGSHLAPQTDSIQGDFDAIFLQHDNSHKANKIKALQIPIYTFYGSYIRSKHGPLYPGFDFVCDPNQTMVANVLQSLEKLFSITPSSENGLTPLPGLIHRRYLKRVAIHPSSSSPEKNWPLSKFEAVAERLKKEGYEPVILPQFKSLSDLTSFIYESGYFLGNDSGPGHIASYLKIPYLIIGRNEKQMRLWRPGWGPGEIITPPSWIPDWKIIRNNWKKFITINSVINKLNNKILKN